MKYILILAFIGFITLLFLSGLAFRWLRGNVRLGELCQALTKRLLIKTL